MRAVVVEGRSRDGSRGHPSDAARRAPPPGPASAPYADPAGLDQPGGGRIVAFGTLSTGPTRRPEPRAERIAAVTGFDAADMVTARPPDGGLPTRAADAPPAGRPAPAGAPEGRTRQTFRAVAFGNPTAGGAEVVPFDPADAPPPGPWRPDPANRVPGGDPPVDPSDRFDRSDPAGIRRGAAYTEFGREPAPPPTGFRDDAPPGWRGFRGTDPPGRRDFPAADPPGGRRFPDQRRQPVVAPVPGAPDAHHPDPRHRDPRHRDPRHRDLRQPEPRPTAAGPTGDGPAAPSLLDRVSFTGIQRAVSVDEPGPASPRGRSPDGGSALDEVSFTGYQPAIREGWQPRGAAREGARPPAGAERPRPGRRPPDGERARFAGHAPQAGEPAAGTAVRRADRPRARFGSPPEEARSPTDPYDRDDPYDRQGSRERGGGRARTGGPASGPGARPGGRRRRGDRPGLLQAALVLAALVVGVSLGRTLALPGDAGTISRLADWGRANHLSFLVDRVDALR